MISAYLNFPPVERIADMVDYLEGLLYGVRLEELHQRTHTVNFVCQFRVRKLLSLIVREHEPHPLLLHERVLRLRFLCMRRNRSGYQLILQTLWMEQLGNDYIKRTETRLGHKFVDVYRHIAIP